jgi:hypothetical protein
VKTLAESVERATDYFNWLSEKKKLEEFYSVREIKMIWSEGGYESDTFTLFAKSEERRYVDNILERNRIAWKQCQDATIICLAFKMKKLKISDGLNLDRNIWNIIVQKLWETRGTKLWVPKDVLT